MNKVLKINGKCLMKTLKFKGPECSRGWKNQSLDPVRNYRCLEIDKVKMKGNYSSTKPRSPYSDQRIEQNGSQLSHDTNQSYFPIN